MSFKKNFLANYVSQIYVALIGIVMVPMYVRYMGVEAYGLVGFFAVVQAWFQLLDMGLTPTMAREAARFNGGAAGAVSLRRLLRALEGVFIGVAVLGAGAMMIGSEIVAKNWLKVQQLPLVEVQHAITLMAVVIALRWISGLYRGAINGFERLVWLSGFNIIFATARFLAIIPFFIYVGTSPTLFFSYQLVLAVAELMILIVQTYRLLPKIAANERMPWEWAPLRKVLRFSLSIAFTSSVWVFATQVDKLLLSKWLSLSDYAYFTLAVIAASAVMLVSIPASNALMPRLAKLHAEGNNIALQRLYRQATQLVCVIAIPICVVLVFFAETVLWAWTGDATATANAGPILRLYALGNGILVLAAFPYYLQYANGDLKLHIRGNIIFVCLLVPSLLVATMTYGALGAAYTWLVLNAFSFFIWVPIVHRRFFAGQHMHWLKVDIIPIIFFSVASIVPFLFVLPRPMGQLAATATLIGIGVIATAFGALGSSSVRSAVLEKRWRPRTT